MAPAINRLNTVIVHSQTARPLLTAIPSAVILQLDSISDLHSEPLYTLVSAWCDNNDVDWDEDSATPDPDCVVEYTAPASAIQGAPIPFGGPLPVYTNPRYTEVGSTIRTHQAHAIPVAVREY
ncbi:hypothetical protein C8R44DRAFT_740200 [Mycena epipterygia]|nr:hypothetical protein C8R44DRAFT_740200 [Mycena epipterygia]